jgi:NADH-quinone oxidoreductase subunit F
MHPNLSRAAPLIDSGGSEPAGREQPVAIRRLRLVEPAAAPTEPPTPAPPSGPAHPPSHRARRVLHPKPLASLADYRAAGGLRGLQIAQATDPTEITATVLESRLRGRGGAGFPAGRKWQTVASNAQAGYPAAVVVNGAEGEPGTFKDRSILRHNPYQVVEGAFIAARAVHADRVVIALKASFTTEVRRTRAALAEMRMAGVLPASISCSVFEGPDEYLYGEESALLETIDGRGPFPRVVPPYRVGLLDQGPHRGVTAGPALVNNLETIANVPKIVARGARWFRSIGTPESPGSVVCTVTGDVRQHGVGEVRMGTPLQHVVDTIGGGPVAPIKAVLSGVANPVILGDQLDLAVSHEGMRSAGCGLGSAGFIVFAQPTDMVAVAAGIARFLSVESCGQCTPCKTDGTELSTLLRRLARSEATATDLETIERRIRTVDYGARCYLAVQQATVLDSILERFRDEFTAHVTGQAPPAEPAVVAELFDIRDGAAVVDERHLDKQPDWSFGRTSSGTAPAEQKDRYRTRVPDPSTTS